MKMHCAVSFCYLVPNIYINQYCEKPKLATDISAADVCMTCKALAETV